MGISVDTVATAIAALSVTGLTIVDLDGMIDEIDKSNLPLMQPGPDFMTGIGITRDSFGPGSSGLKSIGYNLEYRLFYIEAGSVRGIHEIYQGLAQLVADILDAFIANDDLNGCVDIQPIGQPAFGVLTDPVDNEFFGADFVFHVLEFSEV